VTLLDGVDPERVLPMIGGGEVDEMFAPPTVLAKLVEAAGDRRYRRLKTIFCGTATLMPALYMRAREVFGPVVRVTYGKSEVFNPITVLEAAETDLWYAEGGSDADACVGWPASGVAIDVRTTTGAPARVGEEGEVLIWAQHLMRGYLCLEGYERLRLDRSHDTGDLGYLDERGRLHLTGRIADMIKTGGYKVSPEEVERPMAAALSPSAVAALGIPSDYWGEVIVLAVEKPGRDWSDRAREVASRMTAYKRPRAFLTMDQLPRSGIGKVKRSAIREHVLTAYRLVDGPRPRLEPRERADD
jgi:acyl-CoA synthetase (AMP-forming)/AMP-acid ligase II